MEFCEKKCNFRLHYHIHRKLMLRTSHVDHHITMMANVRWSGRFPGILLGDIPSLIPVAPIAKTTAPLPVKRVGPIKSTDNCRVHPFFFWRLWHAVIKRMCASKCVLLRVPWSPYTCEQCLTVFSSEVMQSNKQHSSEAGEASETIESDTEQTEWLE